MSDFPAFRQRFFLTDEKDEHTMHFKIFSRITIRGRRWYFRLVAKNNKTIAQSEGYVNRLDCLQTVQVIQQGARHAPVVQALP